MFPSAVTRTEAPGVCARKPAGAPPARRAGIVIVLLGPGSPVPCGRTRRVTAIGASPGFTNTIPGCAGFDVTVGVTTQAGAGDAAPPVDAASPVRPAARNAATIGRPPTDDTSTAEKPVEMTSYPDVEAPGCCV